MDQPKSVTLNRMHKMNVLDGRGSACPVRQVESRSSEKSPPEVRETALEASVA